jgi:hypothetical protein
MPEMCPGFVIRPMPASVEGVASLFCRRATLPVQHYPRRQGRPRGCAIITKPMERPSAHQVVKPLGQDGTALSVTFLIDVELLLRKCNVVSFRTFHAISNSQSDANLHRHRIISAASGLSASRTFLQFLYYIAHDRRDGTASSACGSG